MQKITNIALIGYGYWGQTLYRYIKSNEKFLLKYVFGCSLQEDKEFTGNLNKIWEDQTIGAVIIATPIDTHYTIAKKALLCKKNVLCEKPLTLKTKEALELKRISEQNNLLLMTEYTYTFSCALLHAQKIINKGVIGPVKSIYITIKQLGRFLGHDVFTLIGSHALSILDIFFPLNKCNFHSRPMMYNNGLVTNGLINFESNDHKFSGYIDVSLHCPVREKKVVVYGEKGTIIYDPYAADTLTIVSYSREHSLAQKDLIQEEQRLHFDEGHNLRFAIEVFSEELHNRKGGNLERAISITSVLQSLNTSLKNDFVHKDHS